MTEGSQKDDKNGTSPVSHKQSVQDDKETDEFRHSDRAKRGKNLNLNIQDTEPSPVFLVNTPLLNVLSILILLYGMSGFKEKCLTYIIVFLTFLEKLTKIFIHVCAIVKSANARYFSFTQVSLL